MSKISLEGNASGSGTLTIAAPNTNSNFTLTLPTNSGTIITGTLPDGDLVGTTATQTLTNKSIVATQLTGTIAAARLPAGTVLQVVSTAKTDTFSTTSTSFVDVTGLSVTITPSSASSKILVFAQVSASMTGDAGQAFSFKVVGGNTASYIGDSAGNRVRGVFGVAGVSGGAYMAASSIMYLDSPATTSATTYKIQAQTGQSATTSYVNRSGSDSNNIDTTRGASSITVMEIAA
jgi:hypothetical protein